MKKKVLFLQLHKVLYVNILNNIAAIYHSKKQHNNHYYVLHNTNIYITFAAEIEHDSRTMAHTL